MFKEFCDFLCSRTDEFITVEINPPHGASIDGIISDIRKHNLHEKVSGFSCTDNPLAKLKCLVYSQPLRYNKSLTNPSLRP